MGIATAPLLPWHANWQPIYWPWTRAVSLSNSVRYLQSTKLCLRSKLADQELWGYGNPVNGNWIPTSPQFRLRLLRPIPL